MRWTEPGSSTWKRKKGSTKFDFDCVASSQQLCLKHIMKLQIFNRKFILAKTNAVVVSRILLSIACGLMVCVFGKCKLNNNGAWQAPRSPIQLQLATAKTRKSSPESRAQVGICTHNRRASLSQHRNTPSMQIEREEICRQKWWCVPVSVSRAN